MGRLENQRLKVRTRDVGGQGMVLVSCVQNMVTFGTHLVGTEHRLANLLLVIIIIITVIMIYIVIINITVIVILVVFSV